MLPPDVIFIAVVLLIFAIAIVLNKITISINELGIEDKEKVNLKITSLFQELSKILEYHIGASAEMLIRLRKNYRKYNNKKSPS